MKVKLYLLLATLLSVTAGFAQVSPLTKYLPHNASMVVSFNPIKIANKVPGETFRQSSLYREMMKNDDGELRAFMSDPSVSGIDFSHDLVLAVVVDTSTENPGTSINVLGLLKNEALFSLLINKLNKSEAAVATYGNNKIFIPKNGGPAIGWNNEIFVFTTGDKASMTREISDMYSDTAEVRDYAEKYEAVLDHIGKVQRNTCFELLTPKAQNPFYSNVHYTQLMMQSGDFRIWNNGSGLGNSMGKIPPPVAALLSQLRSISASEKTSIVNFENGKISGINQNFLNPEMAAIYKKYPTTPLNTDLARRLPKEGKLLGLMATSMNPAMAKEMMQKSGLAEMFDSLKGKLSFDFNLLTSAFKSNMLMAVMDMPVKKVESDENAEGHNKMFNGLEVIMAMPIASKEKFEELKNSVSKIIDSLKGDGAGENLMKGFNPVVKYNDSLCVISMSEESATAFLNNPGTEAVPEWLQEYSSYPMVANLNMREMMNMLFSGKRRRENEEDQEAKKIFDRFDKIIITGGNYENGSLNSKMELRFSNPNENAMKQLFEVMNESIEAAEKAKETRRKEYSDEGVKVDMAPAEEMKIEAIEQAGEKPVPPPPPPPPKKSPTKVKAKKFTPPVIKKDEEVEKPPVRK